MKPDLYDTLGVEKDATKEEIKKAYKKKAKTTHPDKGGNADEFTKITIAYSVLSDNKERERYDDTGKFGGNKKSVIDEKLVVIFFEVIKQMKMNSPSEVDIVKSMVKLVEAKIQNLKNKKKAISNQVPRFEDIKKRIKKKKRGFNLLKNAIEENICAMKNDLKKVEYDIKDEQEIIKKINEYEYNVDNMIFRTRSFFDAPTFTGDISIE